MSMTNISIYNANAGGVARYYLSVELRKTINKNGPTQLNYFE